MVLKIFLQIVCIDMSIVYNDTVKYNNLPKSRPWKEKNAMFHVLFFGNISSN